MFICEHYTGEGVIGDRVNIRYEEVVRWGHPKSSNLVYYPPPFKKTASKQLF
jgi:hypothetical protein